MSTLQALQPRWLTLRNMRETQAASQSAMAYMSRILYRLYRQRLPILLSPLSQFVRAT